MDSSHVSHGLGVVRAVETPTAPSRGSSRHYGRENSADSIEMLRRNRNKQVICGRGHGLHLQNLFSWSSPLRRETPRSRIGDSLPSTIWGLVVRLSLSDQLWIVLLAIALVILDTIPIELQRRLVNSLKDHHALEPILSLAVGYAGVVLAQGLLKLVAGIYRSWVSENSIRALRSFINNTPVSNNSNDRGKQAKGVEISMIVAESDPVGSFVGDSIAEPVQQIGVLVAVLGYLTYLNPLMAFVAFLVFSPQFVLVPLLQLAINRRVQQRIATLRKASSSVVQGDFAVPSRYTGTGTPLRESVSLQHGHFQAQIFA